MIKFCIRCSLAVSPAPKLSCEFVLESGRKRMLGVCVCVCVCVSVCVYFRLTYVSSVYQAHFSNHSKSLDWLTFPEGQT